jgi:four helix bundle protein
VVDKNTQNIRSYRDLEVWRKAMELAQKCYEITADFPNREVYGLASQIRRAAVSIPSNIAEGHSRRSRQAYLNHISIALGSQSELETQIDLSCRLGFISKQSSEEILLMAAEVGRMLHGLVSSLERGGT